MHGCMHRPPFGRGRTQEKPKQVLRPTSLRRHLVPSKRKLIILAQNCAQGREEASCPQKSNSTILHSSLSRNASGIKP